MNAETYETHKAARFAAAERVLASWDLVQFCPVCDGICEKKCRVCPNCHSYQFETGFDVIWKAVETAVEHVFPIGQPVVPRLKTDAE